MRKLSFILSLILLFLAVPAQAQSVDEILNNYFENTGGLDQWKSLEGIKMNAKVNQQGMEIPLEIIQLKDGRQMTTINFQGKEIKQGVFDGEVLWGHNFMTMKAEKNDAEATANFKLETNDFPDPFIDYKEKGYTVEFMGTEEIEGTETYKLKLVREPLTIDGNEEQNVSFYFFDTENYVPLAVQSEIRSGQAKGMTQEITFSDYQEVDGLYFPFAMTSGLKDGPSNPMSFESIELNPQVEEAVFAFPEEIVTEEKN
ncbi:MAG: outer membrane lipoprotein-sorting protein [Eudoraea sp.]|nr:outer membrane lipoprotein-sorting protein [Eudoraea sp.]MBT8210909.1 outer membrane lipoprotein-sorting protein [Eudoraea sp.]NNK30421.1 outer membrane lipoprotein-sorting protein [Flavobacteriaceae bacterium]